MTTRQRDTVDSAFITGEPVCCRPVNDTHERANVTIKRPAEYWGTIAKCDTPYWLAVNMLQHIARTHTDVCSVPISLVLMFLYSD